jgi:hypothetical protein
MKTIKLSDLSEYSGIDVSNEISLYEYGLLCKIYDNNDIHCYYGIGSNDGCNYDTFNCITLSKWEIIDLFNELDKPGLLSYTGQTEKEFLNLSPIQQLSDLKSYFGIENIFGSIYNSFEIENN